MNFKGGLIALQALLLKQISRVFRVWTQTILPSAITMTLYFVIFGHLMGSRIGTLEGFPYSQYIAPGLIMISIITNSYADVTFSFFITKFQRSIEELLVSPMSNALILAGFVAGGVFRGLVVGLVVTLISAFFAKFTIHYLSVMLLVAFLAALLFSVTGFINAIFAKKFDDIAIIPTFVLTPLTYLGGVFYSIHMLPKPWCFISYANPILYMVSTFRYGVLGVCDVNIGISLSIILATIIILIILALYLLKKGIGIRA